MKAIILLLALVLFVSGCTTITSSESNQQAPEVVIDPLPENPETPEETEEPIEEPGEPSAPPEEPEMPLTPPFPPEPLNETEEQEEPPEPPTTQLAIVADEKGYYIDGKITELTFEEGEMVEITFTYNDDEIYFGGLDIEASNGAFPDLSYKKGSGDSHTVAFIATESFDIKSYWPNSSKLKAVLKVEVEA